MLEFSSEQMVIFNEQMERERVINIQELCAYLRENSYQGLNEISDEELELKAKKSITIAETFDLYSKSDIYTFVMFDVSVVPNFHKRPEVGKLLMNSDLSSNNRMPTLLEHLPSSFWKELSRIDPDSISLDEHEGDE